jgi:hypothetical protein
MTLKFSGKTIQGTHTAPQVQPGDLHRRAFQHFGVVGETEIIGDRGGRTIAVEIWLHNDYSYNELQNALDDLEHLRGSHGTLEVDGRPQVDNVRQTFKSCTLLAVEPLPFHGAQTTDVVQDTGGTVGEADSWIANIRLMFRQLLVR